MITAASLSALDLTYQSVLLGPVASTTAERLFKRQTLGPLPDLNVNLHFQQGLSQFL